VVGEEYVPLGSPNVTAAIAAIQAAFEIGLSSDSSNQYWSSWGVTLPRGVIFNTLNGDTNVAFFKALAAMGCTAALCPTVSVSIGEPEVLDIGPSLLAGHYASWSYFQALDTSASSTFVHQFQDVYGTYRTVSDPMEAGYTAVNLWVNAVENARSFATDDVRVASYDSVFDAPSGMPISLLLSHVPH
jgi:urea transport system substrate-binding protein